MIDKHMSEKAIAFLVDRSKHDKSPLCKHEIERYVQLGGSVHQEQNFYYTDEFGNDNVFYSLHHAVVKRLVREGKLNITG